MMKAVLLTFILTLLTSCGSISAKNLPEREISVLPIVFGYDQDNPMVTPVDRETLAIANYVFKKELNITFNYPKIYYTDQYLNIQDGDLIDNIFIQQLDIGKLDTGQKIIIFMEYPNQSLNILGFAPLAGIEDAQSRMFFFMNGDQIQDAYILIHELAHIFGAEHVEDKSLMYPYAGDVEDWTMSEETKEQIIQTLARAGI